jgi:hypothetical protein
VLRRLAIVFAVAVAAGYGITRWLDTLSGAMLH